MMWMTMLDNDDYFDVDAAGSDYCTMTMITVSITMVLLVNDAVDDYVADENHQVGRRRRGRITSRART